MKITKSKLRQIIQEELKLLNETVSQTNLDNLLKAMRDIAHDMDDDEWAAERLRQEVEGFIAEELAPDNDMDTDNDGKISADELSAEIEDIKDDL